MIAVGQPCDAGVIRCTRGAAPCQPSSRPWVIAAASLGSGMAFLDSTVLNVALPAVQTDLEVSAREVQWVFGAFALVLAAFLLVGGSLGDRYGRRRVFVVGAAIFAAASVWCALAPGAGHLVAARAVQGAGGALLVPASLAIVGASFEGRLRAKAIGAWAALSGAAMAVGPVLGGWMVEEVSWRAPFLITPAMAVVAIPIALGHVPESRDPQASRLDLVGAVLATTGLGGLVYGLIESSASGFADPVVLSALILGRLMRNCEEQRRSQDRMLMHQTLSKGWCHAGSRLLLGLIVRAGGRLVEAQALFAAAESWSSSLAYRPRGHHPGNSRPVASFQKRARFLALCSRTSAPLLPYPLLPEPTQPEGALCGARVAQLPAGSGRNALWCFGGLPCPGHYSHPGHCEGESFSQGAVCRT